MLNAGDDWPHLTSTDLKEIVYGTWFNSKPLAAFKELRCHPAKVGFPQLRPCPLSNAGIYQACEYQTWWCSFPGTWMAALQADRLCTTSWLGHNLSCVEIRILHGQLVTSLPTLFGNTRKCAIEQRQVMRPTQRLDYFGWGCKKALGKSDHSQEMDCRLALQESRTSFLLEGNTRCQTSWIPPNLTTVEYLLLLTLETVRWLYPGR